MNGQTPSQAEGERDDERDATDGQNPSQTTPSQAEGERDDEDGNENGEGGR
ncbi:hypothetical protein [Streptomyces flaveolus]|uniref:hypothetical protein n=1 Tax=Streptomyces flaveolus TaxID=67297 RepID=UPI0016705CB7|nr:hypothetical protein [Streptomyces flaveolus]GGQ44973.1 hypothetical protein GCM10010216_01290 [Streptomyces flaveolus]